MRKVGNKIVDSVSAASLLQALQTLQNYENSEAEVSFGQDHQYYEGNKSGKIMNFQIYMAKQENKKGKGKQNRQSVSPAWGKGKENRLSQMKSRSHSPVIKNSNKFEKSLNETSANKSVICSVNMKNKQNKIVNKKNERNIEEKQKQNRNRNENVFKASFQSKKILQQKSKNGAAYVPIQFRTTQLMKQKQQKLQKMQQQKQLSTLLARKECTFKPNINSNYKRPKQIIKIQTQSKSQHFPNSQLCEENQFLNQKIVQFQKQSVIDHQNTRIQQRDSKKLFKKYKNDKFNHLLDLIG